jgi:hypothetical protein
VSGKVLIDLNLPALQDDLFDLDPQEYRQVAKTLKKLRTMTWDEIYRDPGFKWERVKQRPGVCSLRLSRSSRALASREGDVMRFIAIHSDHDSAYGRK